MGIDVPFIPVIKQLVGLEKFLLGLGFDFVQPSDQHGMHFLWGKSLIYVRVFKFINNRGMFKEISSEANTKQLRKAKIMDSYRQTTAMKSKVMLTDLCPEEKAKIGDLVRTLETRRVENLALEQKLKQMEAVQKKYLSKITELQKAMEQQKKDNKSLAQQLALQKIKQKERERYIEHLLQQKQQQSKQKPRPIAVVDQFALTDPIIAINQAIQVNPKKKKCKEREVQTEMQREAVGQSRRYPNNSRSFEKIMRGRAQSGASESSKFKKSKADRQEIMINDNEQQEEEEQVLKEEKLYEDENDDDFNELAKKWLELKQKNMEKIKQSYKKSKERQNSSQEKSVRNIAKTIGVPREFNQRNLMEEDDQQGEGVILENNQSFGPKKSRKKYGKETEGDKDFDEIELNKILKSKNFSASRLLNKRRETSQQSQHSPPHNPRVTSKQQLKSSKVPEFQNTPLMKASHTSNSHSRQNIDFYETDLLDIVSSINRK